VGAIGPGLEPLDGTAAGWDAAGSVAKLLQWRVGEQPDREFLYVEDDGPWSYAGIADQAAALHDKLIEGGVRRGDLVVIRVGNNERFPAAAFGIWMAGAGVIAMHPSAPHREVVDVAEKMRPVAIVAGADDVAAREAGVPMVDAAPYPPARINTERAQRFTAHEGVRGDETALVLLTSGSTGKPKGVALSHDSAWSNLRATVSAFRSNTAPSPLPREPRPPNMIANPLSHTAGIIRLLFALYVGRSIVLLRKFDGAVAQRLVARHGIDNLTINPTMMRMLLDQVPANEDLRPVRYVSSGTAPLPPALREEFESRFAVPVLQAYGQTEAFGGIAIESVKDVLAGRRRPGSVGKPLPGVEVRIVGASGEDVARGETGELLVRTSSSTTGYLGTDATSPVDAAGWLSTGDRGHFDEDGYLYITGRSKNIIICGGFNIFPEELEAALARDPAVRDGAVVGVADERLGEIPVALVESTDHGDAVLARVAERLAPYKRPRLLFAVDELPRVTNGKVDRAAATELARNLAKADVHS
jgi:long-chain acyl-CoA synthetase